MPRVIPQRELRNRNAEIINAVSQGESFIVTRNGEPVAEIRPVVHGRSRFVPKAQIIAAFANAPRIDAPEFRTDLDRVIDQDVTW